MVKKIIFIFSIIMVSLLISCSQHQHIFSEEWSFNEKNHWRNGACEHSNKKDLFDEHSFIDGECACGMLYGLEMSLKEDNTYEITKYNGNKNHIKLPNKFNDLYITSIGSKAFYDNGLISVEIPNGITIIKERAFRRCEELESATLPNSLIIIENYAFQDCINLTSITLPNSVTTIGIRSFSNCAKLTSIILSNQIEVLPEATFSGCSNLTDVIIPNSVTTIKNNVFRGCISLSKVFIPNSVKEVGEDIFYKCYNVIINCEYSEKPDCWNNIEFNQEGRPEEWGDYWDGWGTVVWGCTTN